MECFDAGANSVGGGSRRPTTSAEHLRFHLQPRALPRPILVGAEIKASRVDVAMGPLLAWRPFLTRERRNTWPATTVS